MLFYPSFDRRQNIDTVYIMVELTVLVLTFSTEHSNCSHDQLPKTASQDKPGMDT